MVPRQIGKGRATGSIHQGILTKRYEGLQVLQGQGSPCCQVVVEGSVGFDMVQRDIKRTYDLLKGPDLLFDMRLKYFLLQFHVDPSKMLPVRIGRVCPYFYAVFLCQGSGLQHRISIPGMAPTGDIAGGDIGKQGSLISNPLPYIAIQIDMVCFQLQLLRILKILQIPKPITRISTRDVATF